MQILKKNSCGEKVRKEGESRTIGCNPRAIRVAIVLAIFMV